MAKYQILTDKNREVPLKITRFPSGEVNVTLEVAPGTKINVSEKVTVLVQGYEPDTLFILACIKNALEEQFLYSDVKAKVYLFMPYVPNARYDRHMVTGDSFGLQVFAEMLNLLKFDRVIVADPHSPLTPALVKNCVQMPQHFIVMDILNAFRPEFDFLVAPDDGAAKKIYKLAQALNKPVLTLSKTRDPIDGKITGMKMLDQLPHPAHYVGETRCLIVDDICDGGRTFIEAAKILRENGASRVELVVTHGIFSQGLSNLIDNGVDHIYTTDSFEAWGEHKDLSVFKYF